MVVTQVIRQLLPEKRISTSPKNFNSEIGLILSLYEIENYDTSINTLFSIFWKILFKTLFLGKYPDIYVLEYGIDHPHDMKYLTSILKVDISIFTKLDYVHVENFSSIEAIWYEKFLLMKTTRERSYLNYLDEYAKSHGEWLKSEVMYFNTGTLLPENLVYRVENQKVYLDFTLDSLSVTTNLLGQENTAYIALGIDIASYISGKSFESSLRFELDLQPGRFWVYPVWENVFVDSTYNAAPESMRVMIENTKILKGKLVPDYKLGFCIGDMRELGDISGESHKKLVSYLLDADFIFIVGFEMKSYLVPELLRNNYKWLLKEYISSRDAGKELKTYLESIGNKSVILFKWSQNTIFTEEALKEVLWWENSWYELVRQSRDWMEKKEVFFSKK
jgi:UDP-N-acetylmuramoyl-tripeptide--D-alanyl-D-alanine ligase